MIGKVTVKQMADRAPGLLSSGLDLRLAGATDSKSMIVADGDAGFVHAKVGEAIAECLERRHRAQAKPGRSLRLRDVCANSRIALRCWLSRDIALRSNLAVRDP